jgi:hypothetical protein
MPPTTTNSSGQEASDHAGYACRRINDFILSSPHPEKTQNGKDASRRFFGALIKGYTRYLDKTGFHTTLCCFCALFFSRG